VNAKQIRREDDEEPAVDTEIWLETSIRVGCIEFS
jgi:hypothetical protein